MDRNTPDSTVPLQAHNPRVPSSHPDPQTPRKRKPAINHRLPGIKTDLPPFLSIQLIQKRLKSKLSLSYTPSDWQAHLIRRVLQGYDSILCAGTGYGKSLVFEGIAALAGKKKLVIIISPLKALEYDQAEQAKKKGLHAVVINEDTSRSKSLWAEARTRASLVYMSPEMALSSSFAKLWKDHGFRERLAAVVVDEAHCIDEWGSGDFRPQYRQLDILRHYTGQDIPFLACTATCSTTTFDTIWDTLAFGCRPFWGLDVGVDRPNLFFLIRELINTREPILDILGILPSTITNETTPDDIPKSLLYFSSENDCRKAVAFLRKCLPAHIRDAVQAFSSTLSTTAKSLCWKGFLSGDIRILCATDAAGMGCNVTDVKYVVSFDIPSSVGVVSQRWGRAGRDGTPGVVTNPAVARLQGKKAVVEPKQNTLRRAKLDSTLEGFFNLSDNNPHGCVHNFFTSHFRPKTQLNTYTSLDGDSRVSPGSRSSQSPFELTWTVISDTAKSSPKSRCCYICNDDIAAQLSAGSMDDPRLSAYAGDFLFPITTPVPVIRPPSSASDATISTNGSTSSSHYRPTVSDNDQKVLRDMLVQWRDEQHRMHGSSPLLAPACFFPPRQLDALVLSAKDIAKLPELNIGLLDKFAVLTAFDDSQRESLLTIIRKWKDSLSCSSNAVARTPQSQRRSEKRQRRRPASPIEPLRLCPSTSSPASSSVAANLHPLQTPIAHPLPPSPHPYAHPALVSNPSSMSHIAITPH
ncbi:hypothetical protein CVT24_010875 [Panaeolus cyanescens]|uniref:DNA 3'-5' helicase n=1 Tax=Panaeolus cyanescens TaxID=181874 RepID=A0A409WDC3_9AGAR|nr:hypothetical protein CVT24_010875 [Panaeolus cyanescens]